LVDIHAEVSTAQQMVGDYAPAIEHAHVALGIAEEADADILRQQALQRLVIALFESDQWSAAIAAGPEMVDILRRVTVKHSDRLRWAFLTIAVAHALRGEERDVGRMMRYVHPVADAHETQYIGLYQGRLALARGDWQEAERLMLRAFNYEPGRQILAALHSDVAELAARTGNRSLFERFGAEALELGWRSGARKALAQAIRARAIVSLHAHQIEDAQADLANALKRYQDLGTPWEVARTRYVLAAVLRHPGAGADHDAARVQLGQALRAFEELGAIADAGRARSALTGGEVRLI
jgi:tetratricopeptide (TPR) repeat protein